MGWRRAAPQVDLDRRANPPRSCPVGTGEADWNSARRSRTSAIPPMPSVGRCDADNAAARGRKPAAAVPLEIEGTVDHARRRELRWETVFDAGITRLSLPRAAQSTT